MDCVNIGEFIHEIMECTKLGVSGFEISSLGIASFQQTRQGLWWTILLTLNTTNLHTINSSRLSYFNPNFDCSIKFRWNDIKKQISLILFIHLDSKNNNNNIHENFYENSNEFSEKKKINHSVNCLWRLTKSKNKKETSKIEDSRMRGHWIYYFANW